METTQDTIPMDKVAVARYLNCSVPQIANLVARGSIPEGVYIGGRKKYWFKAHLDEYKARMMAQAEASWGSPVVKVAKPVVKPVVKPAKRTNVPLTVVSQAPTRMYRGEEDLDDTRRRQKAHIQESYQDNGDELLDEGAAEHLKSILGDLSDLLKRRKQGA